MQSKETHLSSQGHSSTSKFREHLSVYIPPPNLPIEISRFSPESPPLEPGSRTQSVWTNTSTTRSLSPVRKDNPDLRGTPSLSAISRKSRLSKFWVDVSKRMGLSTTHHEPEQPIHEPTLPSWPPLNIEKRRCAHDCPCYTLTKENKKKHRRDKILICVLVIILLYLLGNTIALNVHVFGPSAPPSTTHTENTTSTDSTLSQDAQQCLAQYVVDAPSNPSQYPCSTCLSVLQSVPPSFFNSNPSDGQQIINAIQFCALRAVFVSTSEDGQSLLKNGNWAQDVRFCAWDGVQCDGTGRVASL